MRNMEPNKIKLQITEEHAADGLRPSYKGNCETCPAALALRPLFPGKIVRVTGIEAKIYDTDNNLERKFKCPSELRVQIALFDTVPGHDFEPAIYELTEVEL